ncbi:hypothetical protein N7G274_008759 [Stereocaulon virgatum]|uniref:tyrosinase n=1 Tax=Stereocaulon virgatum TaxID=373712 RepID=A0ABR3ZXR9_9LECA
MGEVDKPKGAKDYEGLGLGHMSDVPVAAFDPIFWHHHANLDRILAMWQTLDWDKWFDAHQKDDPLPSDPLLPFHTDTEKHPWSSDRARSWIKLGYQYDDLVPQHGVTEGSPQYLNDLPETHYRTISQHKQTGPRHARVHVVRRNVP